MTLSFHMFTIHYLLTVSLNKLKNK